MKAFREAAEKHLEGIEFDVWISKDGVPVVIHGGIDGELTGHDDSKVWQQTAAELAKLDIGEGESIPRLDDVLALCKRYKRLLINIELKGPRTESDAAQYDFDQAARKVIALIDRHDVGKQTMISSFRRRIIDSVIRASSPPYKRNFVVQSLRNAGRLPDPDNYEVFAGTTGINLLFNYLEEDIVQKIHDGGNYAGVWYAADTSEESDEMWNEVFTINSKGVDFFYSDKPLEAM